MLVIEQTNPTHQNGGSNYKSRLRDDDFEIIESDSMKGPPK